MKASVLLRTFVLIFIGGGTAVGGESSVLTPNGTWFVTRSVSEGLWLFMFTENSLADASG